MKTRPFNIDEAKAGAKVVNRDGDPVRIVCFDGDYGGAVVRYPIIDSFGRVYKDDGSFLSYGQDNSDLLLVSEPRLRPWKPEEVPVGAVVKSTKSALGDRWLITAMHNGSVYLNKANTSQNAQSMKDILESFHWKWPQEPDSALKPCGVEE